MSKKYFLLLNATILAGCTAMWTNGFKVHSFSDSGIEIWYDPAIAFQEQIKQQAQAHCSMNNKSAELEWVDTNILVSSKVYYRCI